MSTLQIGLVGCGRVGRCLVRLLARDEGIRLVVIEDPAEPEAVEYLLRFDTLLGRFREPLARADGALEIAGRSVHLIQPGEAVPDWRALGVSVVVEATGRERRRADLEAHLAAGARRVR